MPAVSLPASARPAGVVVSAEDMRRALRRMAHQILERNGGADGLVLLGIPTRGVPLAGRLADAIGEIEGRPAPVGSLDVTLYRDDYARTGPKPLGRTALPVALDGRVVVLVDDVLYTGRSISAAMAALQSLGRPAQVELAVMVERRFRRHLPIAPDYLGVEIDALEEEYVRVRWAQVDGVDEVVLYPSKAASKP